MWLRYNENTENLGTRLINSDNLKCIYRFHTDVLGCSRGTVVTDAIQCKTVDEAEYVLQAIYAGIENGRKTLDINETIKRFREKKGW